MSSRVLPDFELFIPTSLAECLDILARQGDKATVMAGGTDILVMMKASFRPDIVVSLVEVPGLDAFEWDAAKGLRLGAAVTVSQLLASAEVRRHYPALWQAAENFATPQIRNRATVIGNLLRASPAGDCSCAILALGGTVVFAGPAGRREVDIDKLWLAYNVTARKPDELAVELRLPPPGAGTRSGFHRLTRVNEDLAKLNAAVRLEMDGTICKSARMAMGCVGPTMLRLPKCEAAVTGKTLDETVLKSLQDIVQSEISPIDDKRSTAEYRRSVAGVVLKRIIRHALEA